MSSVAYWYAAAPSAAVAVPALAQRLPVLRDDQGRWLHEPARSVTSCEIPLNDEMRAMKAQWAAAHR